MATTKMPQYPRRRWAVSRSRSVVRSLSTLHLHVIEKIAHPLRGCMKRGAKRRTNNTGASPHRQDGVPGRNLGRPQPAQSRSCRILTIKQKQPAVNGRTAYSFFRLPASELEVEHGGRRALLAPERKTESERPLRREKRQRKTGRFVSEFIYPQGESNPCFLDENQMS